MFKNNCRAIGRADLIDDPRFQGNGDRCLHSDELNEIFSDWCLANDLEFVLSSFNAAQGTLAPIYSMDQVAKDPQLVARKAIAPVADVDFGTVAMQAVVPRFATDPVENRWSAGALGTDNATVY
jgi:crotonobetainyl-CoA:carnitine CoA-transferase CaiB-like acyl-CoA transferase